MKVALHLQHRLQGPKTIPKPSSADEGMAVPKEAGMLPPSMKFMKYVVAVTATIAPALGNKSAPTIILHFLLCQRFKVIVSGEPFWRRLIFVEASQTEGCVRLWRCKIAALKGLDANLIGK
jgi:hypothetical protein